MTNTTVPSTCTVVVGFDQRRCGQPAVTTFTSKRTGQVFAECATHDVSHIMAQVADEVLAETAASLGIKTASTSPFVLVRDGAIVGYARTDGPAVAERARKLGARILPTR